MKKLNRFLCAVSGVLMMSLLSFGATNASALASNYATYIEDTEQNGYYFQAESNQNNIEILSQTESANSVFALLSEATSERKSEVFSTSAQACAVVERSSGRVLFQKNAHRSLPMASTTKIVTALTVLNNCADLEKSVKIPDEAVGVEGSSVYLRSGEHLTIRELLLGLMLRSGNDCAVALAVSVGGSVENFAEMMNQTAANLGCDESHFVNPHGLHDSNHYTSASDLAKITCAALNNEVFRDIVATKSVKIANEGFDYPRVLINKNKLLSLSEGADGVKTGYTKKAGRCFVGSATRNGMQVVCVVLNCGPMFEETSKMLDAAFENYSLKCVIPQNKLCGVEYLRGKPTYFVAEQFWYPLKSDEVASTKITLDDCKKIDVFVNGELVRTQPLLAER